MKSAICVVLYTLLVYTAAQGNETDVGGSNETTTEQPEVFNTTQEIITTTEQPILETTTEDYNDTYNDTMTTEMPFTNTTEDMDNETMTTTMKPENVVCSLSADLDGDWWSTLWGNLSVFDGQLFGVDIDHQGDTVLKCQPNGDNDGFLIFREEPASNSSNEDVFYTCIKFERRNRNNFHVQIKTARNSKYSNQAVVAMPYDQDMDDPNIVCNGLDNMMLHGDLIRKGNELEGALGCPQLLRGNFNQTFASTDCPDGAEMSSCKKPKALSFDYSQCNETEKYSGMEELICVAGGSNQVTTLNLAEDSPGFECATLTEDHAYPDSIDVTVRSRGCGDDWEAGLAVKHETSYVLDKTSDCEGTTPPNGPVTQKPGRHEDRGDAGSVVGPSTLLVTGVVSLILWVTSRNH